MHSLIIVIVKDRKISTKIHLKRLRKFQVIFGNPVNKYHIKSNLKYSSKIL